jgi:tetraacyldisaccharide 4'-kinase
LYDVSFLRKKIESVMIHGSEFRFTSFFETSLYLISLAYAGTVSLRALSYKKGILKSRRLRCTVISIGNVTVGGTGKTPLTIHVAGLLRGLGYKVAVLSRGYKGCKEKSGGVVSDGQRIHMSPEAAGDEPYLMALKLDGVPVLVGRDRLKIGMLAIREFGSEILVLDDAFQHLQLDRDLDLVLLDAVCPFGNGHFLPRGILREPLRQLVRGDAFVLTRSDPVALRSGSRVLNTLAKGRPVFQCMHVPDVLTEVKTLPSAKREKVSYDLDFLKGRRVLAFSGIARNEDFRMMIENQGCAVARFLSFPDHHKYSDEDLETIRRSADQSRVEHVVTTEKDYVRISHRVSWPIKLLALGIRVSFGDAEKAFSSYLSKKVRSLRGNRSRVQRFRVHRKAEPTSPKHWLRRLKPSRPPRKLGERAGDS